MSCANVTSLSNPQGQNLNKTLKPLNKTASQWARAGRMQVIRRFIPVLVDMMFKQQDHTAGAVPKQDTVIDESGDRRSRSQGRTDILFLTTIPLRSE